MARMSTELHSPLGWLWLEADERALKQVVFRDTSSGGSEDPPAGLLAEVVRQLTAYFDRRLTVFDLPLEPEGTPFQQRVWTALQAIPFGRSCSYGELARALGDVRLTRAVGNANGSNPIPLIIPCHRVLGSRGDLVGFGGGLWRKEWLLRHEGLRLL